MKPILKSQLPPTHIKVEFTEGCNLYCSFCPIQSIRKGRGGLRFMSLATAKRIANEVTIADWKPKFEFTGHGEPLLNKNYMRYYRLFRKSFPKAYMFTTTNGGKLLAGKGPTYNIDRILRYINVIAMDDYEHSGFIPKVLKSYKGKYKIFVYPEMPTYSGANVKDHYAVVYPDISKAQIKERCLSNTACNAGPPNFDYINKTCHRPFRELNIAYDGSILLCCYDWSHEYVIGNINGKPLEDIWQHGKFRAARRILHHKGRQFSICYGCDNRLYRIGLLPDRMGKFTLKKPTKLDWLIVRKIEKMSKIRRHRDGIRDIYSKLSKKK
jgi:radical SAM protein with 4Fe4S-binding SPASM domain